MYLSKKEIIFIHNIYIIFFAINILFKKTNIVNYQLYGLIINFKYYGKYTLLCLIYIHEKRPPIDGHQIEKVRLLLIDLCPYSCGWCAVHQYKQGNCASGSGHNEGALVQNINLIRGKVLSVANYELLAHVLTEHFGTQDFTLTGGDPFLRREYRTISQVIKSQHNSHLTSLTKGEPLYRLITKQPHALDFTDRVIFSLDTLDPEQHAQINLPLTKQSIALGYLSKTFNAIKIVQAKSDVSINTVVPPDYHAAKTLIFDILSFAVENDIEDVKFIELDTEDVTEHYIEKFIQMILIEFETLNLPVIWKREQIPQGIRKLHVLTLKTKSNKELKIYTYRLTCSHEHKKLSDSTGKCCEISKYESLTINTTGDIIPCTGNPTKKLSLHNELQANNVPGIIKKISSAVIEIQNQSCPDRPF